MTCGVNRLHPQQPQPCLPAGGVGLGLLGEDWAAQVECEAEHFNLSHPLESVAKGAPTVRTLLTLWRWPV